MERGTAEMGPKKAQDYDTVIREKKDLMESLLMRPRHTIREIVASSRNHDVPGVYVLYTPNGSEIVYVGKTRTGTIASRIRDHKNLNESSDLKAMLGRFKNHPQNREDYLVQYLNVSDDRQRTLLEHFLISILNPSFNR